MLLRRKAAKFSSLVLTFDDGPGKRLTPAILKLLAENNAKATFFLLGRNMVGREEIVKQIAEQGHEICSHGYDHINYWKVSPLRAIKDIKQGFKAIDAALGVQRNRYSFRPPYGKLNIVCLIYLLIYKVPIVYWTVDSGDTWEQQANSCRAEILVERAGGAVLLAHDFDRRDASLDKFTADSLRSVLELTKDRRMQTLTVSEFLTKGR